MNDSLRLFPAFEMDNHCSKVCYLTEIIVTSLHWDITSFTHRVKACIQMVSSEPRLFCLSSLKWEGVKPVTFLN